MDKTYLYIFAFICIAVGITLTYLGYEYGKEEEKNNVSDETMLAFGIIFIVVFFFCLFFLYRTKTKN